MNPTYGHDVSPPVGEQDHVQGSPNAPIVLVEYCDYQSAQCAQAHQIIQQLQCQLGEKFCFVLRHFPSPSHPQSLRAAEAVEAANAQEKFWLMHNTLFAHQRALEDADLVEYANTLNLDIPRFLRELSTRMYLDRVQTDIDSGRSNGVEEAPTFFISVRHTGAQNLEALLMTLLQTSMA
jgi:protein-disulfide isomerase